MHPQRESPGGTNYHRAQSFLQSAQSAGGVGHTHRGGAWTEGEEGDKEVDASSPVTAQHVTSPPRRLRLCLSRADLEMAPSGSRHPSVPVSQLRKRRLREAKQLARARSPLSFQVAKQDSNPGLGLHVRHGGAACAPQRVTSCGRSRVEKHSSRAATPLRLGARQERQRGGSADRGDADSKSLPAPMAVLPPLPSDALSLPLHVPP